MIKQYPNEALYALHWIRILENILRFDLNLGEFMNEEILKTLQWAERMYNETNDPAFKRHLDKAKELLGSIDNDTNSV